MQAYLVVKKKKKGATIPKLTTITGRITNKITKKNQNRTVSRLFPCRLARLTISNKTSILIKVK